MVTDENFGELLIEGLEEVAAHQRGELPAAKVVRRLRFTGGDEGPALPPSDPDPWNRGKS
jgi:hypothetical protein